MSLEQCLSALKAEGKLDARHEEQARKIYEELRETLGDTLGADEAAAKATADTLDRLKREAAESRRRTLLQATRQQEILKNLRGYRNANDEDDWASAATAHLDADEAANFSNVEARRKSILGQAHSRMTDVLATFRRDLLGRVREDAKLDNLVRVAFGERVDDASARELASAWTNTAEWLRTRFNQAGGHIPKREDWGLPQSHDMLAVRKAGYDQWRTFVRPRLDPSRMLDELTGRPMTPAQLDQALKNVYETIATGGLNKTKPSGVGGGRSVGNRHADHRFLAFKDADSWLEYQGMFGSGTPFDAMLDHVNGMARDVAMMEVLGPAPTATLRWLEQMVTKEASERDMRLGGDVMSNKARKAVKQMWDMWAHLSGAASAPVDRRFSRAMAGTRSLLVSAQLGSAAISAIGDLATQFRTRRFDGLPVVGMLGDYLKLMNPANKADQKLAVRLGLIADGWSTVALAQQRYADEVAGPEFARRLADFTMRASLLSPWTQAGRWAFGMETMGFLADQRGKSFDALPEPLANMLKRYGIDEQDWEVIRRTPLYEHEGATFLRPDDVEDPKITTKLLEAIQTETDYAVVNTSLRARTFLVSNLQPGTFIGEVARSFSMYKNFGVSMLNTHGRRSLMQKGAMSKAGYAANLLIAMTVMGAVSYQMKQIKDGKDPVTMTGENAEKFWGAAMLQGGGLGVYGDFVFSNLNRHDRGLEETIAGPVFSTLNDVKNLTLGNLIEAARGEDTKAGREAIKFAGRYTPGGSLWYSRLAFQRIFLDQLQKEIDPDYQDSFDAMERRARQEMEQDFWWSPGEVEPDRAPSVFRPE